MKLEIHKLVNKWNDMVGRISSLSKRNNELEIFCTEKAKQVRRIEIQTSRLKSQKAELISRLSKKDRLVEKQGQLIANASDKIESLRDSLSRYEGHGIATVSISDGFLKVARNEVNDLTAQLGILVERLTESQTKISILETHRDSLMKTRDKLQARNKELEAIHTVFKEAMN